ncbi:hypothetical protein C8R43DRAFT_1123536 [Mycena crocata]|nr:hypothetical protein C8R43DRAFT_1123536 [Mycena crocata]
MLAVPLLVTGAAGIVLVTTVALTPLDIAAAANFAVDTNSSPRVSVLTTCGTCSTSSPLIRRHRRRRPYFTTTFHLPSEHLVSILPNVTSASRQYPQNRFNVATRFTNVLPVYGCVPRSKPQRWLQNSISRRRVRRATADSLHPFKSRRSASNSGGELRF